ncbi:MAG: TetR/AcrR family transcriptional regulator [Deltaproteobacteria bacterium HGW-Deltaproteobacteria-21]|nr:MAG: TetR/AcrR family transcriptional regulator [Deltaproteobacteria bacterium HGW-Deltaproteobacteria-21]
MAKSTFKQIPEEKRQRVLREAARLFAERGFSATDVAELAKRAGVSKGSLYTYFESKEDLYLHVCEDGLARSRSAVYGEMDPQWDIFRQVEHIFRQGIDFALKHPEYVRLYLTASAPGKEHFSTKVSVDVEKHTADHLKEQIHRAQSEGTVRSDLDPKLGAFFINSLYIIVVSSVVSKHFQNRLKEYFEIKGPLKGRRLEENLSSIIREIHRFLRP